MSINSISRFDDPVIILLAVTRETIGERHASACRYKNEVPEGLRRSARRTHFWPRAGYPEAAWSSRNLHDKHLPRWRFWLQCACQQTIAGVELVGAAFVIVYEIPLD